MTSLLLVVIAASPLLEQIEAVDRQLVAAEHALDEVRQKREELKVHAARRQSELAAARLRYNAIMETYRARVRALARMPSGARMVMLGSSTSLRDYLRTSKLLRKIAEVDRRVAEQRQQEEARIAALEQEARARDHEAAESESTLRIQRDRLAELRAEKITLIEQILRDPESSEALRAQARSAQRTLEGVIRSAEGIGPVSEKFSTNRGRLPWPTAGQLTTRFGQEVEREFGTVVTHAGLDITASAGSPVQTVAPGSVVYADWMRGLGQLVIIDHGENFHSLYAHLGSASVAVGDALVMGDTIGSVGDSGSMRGTLLYFEIRENGVAIDPTSWLREK